MRPPIDEAARERSIHQLNSCNQAITAKHFDAALAACQAALDAWDGNHLAWYARASAHLARGAWREALAAIEHAVALRPDLAMYQLYHGMARYEAGRREAAPAPHLVAAEAALLRAIAIAPALWRAHYYLGRIYRDLDEPRLAAEQLSQAIRTNPGYRPSYVALSQLYRRAGYADQALAVAALGVHHAGADDAGELWFEAGLAHADKRADALAIAALGKAIAARPGDANPVLVRGWLHARRGDLVQARRDLADVVKSAGASAETRQVAQQMLAQLAAPESSRPTTCTATNACDVISAPAVGWAGWAGTDPITRM